MSNNIKSMKVGAGVAIALMLGAITWGTWYARVNNSLERDLDQEKLKMETLLSEKLRVEKNLAASESQLEELVGINEDLSRQLVEGGNREKVKDGSIGQLQRQLATNKKASTNLNAHNHELEGRLALLNRELAQLQDDRLASNNEVEFLRAQVDNLKRDLALAHTSYYDRALVESSRGKADKLVVKATRTKKLKATVMIPSELNNVQFQVFDPDGTLISSSPENGILAVNVTENKNAIASTSTNGGHTFKQAEMVFLPKRKLKAGTYRIEVLSENLAVGSLQVRLR